MPAPPPAAYACGSLLGGHLRFVPDGREVEGYLESGRARESGPFLFTAALSVLPEDRAAVPACSPARVGCVAADEGPQLPDLMARTFGMTAPASSKPTMGDQRLSCPSLCPRFAS